ncbi:MAG: hypothetical protein ABW128_09105, partial [Rhizorhabdus sp.]
RDYAEISERPLREVVAERVAAMQRGAAALASDTTDRSTLLREIAELERERSTVAAAQPEPVERQNLDRAASQVEALASRAEELLPAAGVGGGLLAHEISTARLRAEHVEAEAATTLLAEELARLEASFDIADARLKSPDARLEDLRGKARAEGERLGMRGRLLGDARELRVAVAQGQDAFEAAQVRAAAAQETRRRVNEAERAIRAIRDTAGRVEAAAAEARATVVSEVSMISSTGFGAACSSGWRRTKASCPGSRCRPTSPGGCALSYAPRARRRT